ncbi:hypothetical protein BPAE_0093g00420 [Botrytis paeoniae]|uniref:Uncharacterized protein n=1 Tax=Botrytis paeoniae TaxID=278948 RepID=A0A4Z1FPE4_9HELO|nr:hypothetical protein BPAE_0093g00420 [Botrytis paeoniae]
MDQTPESSQSPLDKAMIDGGIVNILPVTSSNHGIQVATPAASLAAIQSSSDKTTTDGEFITTPPETPFSGNTESNIRQPAPSLSAPSSPTSSCNTPVLPSSFDFLDSIAAVAPYAAGPRPGTYTHQFLTSSIRTPIVRKCGRCVAGCEFKTCSQSRTVMEALLMYQSFVPACWRNNVQFPFSIMVNATTRNPATGNAVIGDDSDATICIASDY